MATGSEPRADLAHDATRQAPAAAAPADRAEGGGPAGVPPPGRQPADALSLLDQIIEKSPIGIAVIDFDGHYRSVNPAYSAMYGYDRSEMLGRSFTMVFPPAQREPVLARHRDFLTVGGELRGEWDVMRRDGVALNIISESVRVPGGDGRTRRLVYVVDITQRKQTELALRSSQAFVQSVLDGLASHVCVLDGAGVIVAVNRAWRDFAAANGGSVDLVGEGSDYLGACERAAQASSGCEAGSFTTLLREVLAGQRQQFEFEYDCHSPAVRRWFLARVSRIAGSEPPRIVVEHDDVTALKQAQEQLRQDEALLQDLAASIPGALFRLVHGPTGEWRSVYVGAGVETLFETGPARAGGSHDALWGPIVPEDRRAHEASMREAGACGGPWEHEYRVRTQGGRIKWIHAHANLKPGDDGSVVWTGLLTDVSDRKYIEDVLKDSEETYRTLFETVPQGVIYQDTLGRITSANPAAQRILGLTLAQLQGLTSIDPRWKAIHEDGSDFPGETHPAMQALRTQQAVHDVVMGIAVPDRGHVWLLVNANPIVKGGVLAGVYATFEDITQRVLLSQELKQQATTDYLTGVANRRRFMERLRIEFERVARHPELRCSVLELDLDHFKHVNDTFGHAAGDAVLMHVTHLMQQETRVADMVGRIGGEEFVLLLPDTGPDEALELGERLRRRVEQSPVQHGGYTIAITASIGISAITAGDSQADAGLARADRALYEAKNAGRNAVRLYRP